MYGRTILTIGAAVLLLQVGCAHTHLRYNTNGQARTVSDLNTQQVLDNLAKFAGNPGALPHFSIIDGSSSGVSDSIPLTPNFSFSPSALSSWSLGTGLTRGADEDFTTIPIKDPRKLELMRCAYQRAIGTCCCSVGASCANCEKLFNNFYLGRTEPAQVPKTTQDGYAVQHVGTLNIEVYLKDGVYYDAVNNQAVDVSGYDLSDVTVPKDIALIADITGKTTIECIDGNCWFNIGSKRDVPKGICKHVGHHCGKYVWVPKCHSDKLTDLTLVILDIALNDPAEEPEEEEIEKPEEPKIEVVARLDANGEPTTSANAAYTVTLQVGADADVTKLFPSKEEKSTTQPRSTFMVAPKRATAIIESRRAPAITIPENKRTQGQTSGLLDFRRQLDSLSDPR